MVHSKPKNANLVVVNLKRATYIKSTCSYSVASLGRQSRGLAERGQEEEEENEQH